MSTDTPAYAGSMKHVRPGDRLVARTAHGGEVRGRVMLAYPDHVVINAGGRYGKPFVVTEANLTRHSPRREE